MERSDAEVADEDEQRVKNDEKMLEDENNEEVRAGPSLQEEEQQQQQQKKKKMMMMMKHVQEEDEGGGGGGGGGGTSGAGAGASDTPPWKSDAERGGLVVRVLVVEDDAVNRTIVCSLLRACGYDVVSAEDGREAIRLLSRGDANTVFSLVLCDIIMPNVDGKGVLSFIRRTKGTVIRAASLDAESLMRRAM